MNHTEADHYSRLKMHADRVKDISRDRWNWSIVSSLTSPTLARLIYTRDLYERVIDTPGEIAEFGTHFGSTASLLVNFRSLFEPRNQSRHIHIFDTFEGLTGVSEIFDGNTSYEGMLKSASNYEKELEAVLNIHESISNWQKPSGNFSIHKGDASISLEKLLSSKPHIYFALVILDMDIYKPTKEVLELIIKHIVPGGILALDEFSCDRFPGETLAYKQVLGDFKLELKRHELMPFCAWTKVNL